MNIRTIVFVLGSLLVSGSLRAQVLIGPVAGGQLSWVTLQQKENRNNFRTKPVFGYHGGVAISFRVRKRFFLSSSVMYSTKGKVVEGIADPLLRHRVQYRYLDIPLLYTVDFKGKVGDNNMFKFYVGLGPNISYWLGGKGSLYTTDFHERQVPETNFRIVFNEDESSIGEDEMTVIGPTRIQLGLNIAAGIIVEPQPEQKWIFQVRYELGHSHFSREYDGFFRDTYYQDELQARNNGIRISLAYQYDLKTNQRKKGKSTIKQNRL